LSEPRLLPVSAPTGDARSQLTYVGGKTIRMVACPHQNCSRPRRYLVRRSRDALRSRSHHCQRQVRPAGPLCTGARDRASLPRSVTRQTFAPRRSRHRDRSKSAAVSASDASAGTPTHAPPSRSATSYGLKLYAASNMAARSPSIRVPFADHMLVRQPEGTHCRTRGLPMAPRRL